MEKSSFFTSMNGDRKYKASEFAEYFSTFIGNGVFPNPSTNLDVVSNGDMTITIRPGFAFINGYMYHNTDNLVLTISHSDSVLKRVDRVVLRCDFIKREIKANIKEGLFSDVPVAKKLQRDVDAYEICIAEIKVNSGVIQIQQSEITSTKLDSNLCGIVTQTVKEIDTTTLFNKLEAYIEERGKDVDGWLTSFKLERELTFNEWFSTIKGVLDGDVAGNLANRILEVENKLKNMKLEDTAITVKDVNNHFKGTKLNEVLEELFISADNIKTTVANAIGSPLSATDIATEMGTKIDGLTNTLKTNLTNKGVAVSGTDKMQGLVEKVNDIEIEKHDNLPWNDCGAYFLPCDKSYYSYLEYLNEHSAACIKDDKLYFFRTANSQMVYDINNNKWSEGIRVYLPSYISCCSLDNLIYVFTFNGSSEYVYIVNTITNTFESKLLSPPYSAYFRTVHAVDGKIYVVAGNSLYLYNHITNTFNRKLAFLKAYAISSMSSIGNIIYIANNVSMIAYDVITNTYEVITNSAPNPQYTHPLSILAFEEDIFMFKDRENWRYNLKTKTFHKFASSQNVIKYPIAIKFKKGGFIMGGNGLSDSSYIPTFEYFTFS